MENSTTYDSTKIRGFLVCPRQYQERFANHLKPVDVDAAPSFGIAIHKGLECWYKTGDADKAVEVFANTPFQVDEKRLRTEQQGLNMLIAYFTSRQEEWKTTLEPHADYVEVRFVAELFGIMYYGRIDRLCRDRNGQLVVEDWKTARQIGESYGLKKERDIQGAGYQFIAEEFLGEPATMRYDVLPVQKKSIYPQTFRNDFSRQRDSWGGVLMETVRQIEICHEYDIWPENWMSCFQWNRPCPYMALCQHPEIRDKLVETEFTLDEWSPMKEEPNESDGIKRVN